VTNVNAPHLDVAGEDGAHSSDASQNTASERALEVEQLETLSGTTRIPSGPANLKEEIDLSSFRLHHYFDYVAGTSTGG
jgi:hypothetical protein